jgi:hypothetical protein
VTGRCAVESPGPHADGSAHQRPHPIVWALPALVLIIAPLLPAIPLSPTLLHLPDAYLTLVRLTVSLCAALIAHATWRKSVAWSLAFAAVGLIYNPVLTLHMTHDAWTIAHVGALLLFGMHWLLLGPLLSRGAGAAMSRVDQDSG